MYFHFRVCSLCVFNIFQLNRDKHDYNTRCRSDIVTPRSRLTFCQQFPQAPVIGANEKITKKYT